MEHHITSTGFVQQVDSFKDKTPDYDPRSGDHLWITVVSYKCDPKKMMQGEQLLMDFENLLNFAGPGCYYCEKEYSALLASRRCKGHP